MKENSGFTLMEMLIAIAIISILSGIAIPNMIAWRNNMQFNSAVRMVKNNIEKTRMDAIKTNMPTQINFSGGNSFDTVKWDLVNNTFAAPVTHPLPPEVIIANSNFAGGQLQFTSRGMPANILGGNLRIESKNGLLCNLITVSNVGSSRIEACP